jgi:hypothetical protein
MPLLETHFCAYETDAIMHGQMMHHLQQHSHLHQQAANSGQQHDGGVDELLDSDSSDEEDQDTSQWNDYNMHNGFQQVSISILTTCAQQAYHSSWRKSCMVLTMM